MCRTGDRAAGRKTPVGICRRVAKYDARFCAKIQYLVGKAEMVYIKAENGREIAAAKAQKSDEKRGKT